MTSWEDEQLIRDEDDDWQYPDDVCERCDATIPDKTGALLTIDYGPRQQYEHVWCDECVDAFDAWRLAKEDVIVRQKGGQP